MAHRIFPKLDEQTASDLLSSAGIGGLLYRNPELKIFSHAEMQKLAELIKPGIMQPGEIEGIKIAIGKAYEDLEGNNGFFIVLSLTDDKHRLSHVDQPFRWFINLEIWGDDEQDGNVRLYHDGDNSFGLGKEAAQVKRADGESFRKDSYGKEAQYSIVKSTLEKYYPQLAPESRICRNWETYCQSKQNHNWVNLGSLPMYSEVTAQNFADMRQRLGMFRLARWLWLRDHPIRI